MRSWRARPSARGPIGGGAKSPVLAALSEDAVIKAEKVSWAWSSECDLNHSAPAPSAVASVQLLRANPPKGGDAEPRGYSNMCHARRAASESSMISCRRGGIQHDT